MAVIAEAAIQVVAVVVAFLVAFSISWRRYGGCIPPMLIGGASSFLAAAIVGRIVEALL